MPNRSLAITEPLPAAPSHAQSLPVAPMRPQPRSVAPSRSQSLPAASSRALCVATAAAVFGLGAANPYATASLGIGAIAIALATLSATTDPGVARSRLIR